MQSWICVFHDHHHHHHHDHPELGGLRYIRYLFEKSLACYHDDEMEKNMIVICIDYCFIDLYIMPCNPIIIIIIINLLLNSNIFGCFDLIVIQCNFINICVCVHFNLSCFFLTFILKNRQFNNHYQDQSIIVLSIDRSNDQSIVCLFICKTSILNTQKLIEIIANRLSHLCKKKIHYHDHDHEYPSFFFTENNNNQLLYFFPLLFYWMINPNPQNNSKKKLFQMFDNQIIHISCAWKEIGIFLLLLLL